MLAGPLSKHCATLSVWRDEAALDGFVGARPHDELMASLVAEMGATESVLWTISGVNGRPTWREALEGLG